MARSRHRTLEMVDWCRSTTTPSGPLSLAQTARGGEGELAGRAHVESVTHPGYALRPALIGGRGISRTTGHGWSKTTAQSADEASVRRTSL